MPPKTKKPEGSSKKSEQKKKEKIIEDKTFGLKNKKGAKQQKYVKMITNQVKFGNQSAKKTQELDANRLKSKEEKKKELEELNKLFRPVQSLQKGADPKSVLCAFFKQGQCFKGDKCKFSHDLGIQRKAAKRSVYEDIETGEDSMDTWDEQKLEEVVNKKHGESNKQKPKTSIICKYFLEAVENSKYGWFWECPNGVEKCIYKHSLPPGFVLKRDEKKEDRREEISLEDLIEKERASLTTTGTKITLQTFIQWKERKKWEKDKAIEAAQEKKKNDYKAGRLFGISGRELFEFNPDLIEQDDDEADDVKYIGGNVDEDSDEDTYSGPVRDITFENVVSEATESCSPGSKITVVDEKETSALTPNNSYQITEAEKLNEAAALPLMNGDVSANVPIDEDLFEGEDLDQIEADLETLDIE